MISDPWAWGWGLRQQGFPSTRGSKVTAWANPHYPLPSPPIQARGQIGLSDAEPP